MLRSRYLGLAEAEVGELLKRHSPVPYDTVWDTTMAWPLVWDCDLKEWIAGWQREGRLSIQNMEQRQRVPKLGESNGLVWK